MAGYRLLTFAAPEGPRGGVAIGDAVYDLAQATGHGAVLDALDDWARAATALADFAAAPKGQSHVLDGIELLPPVLYPRAIYCAGANYSDHVANMARIQNMPPEPDPHEAGLLPWHFVKVSRSAVGHRGTVAVPSPKLDWEIELAAVIGRTMREVSLDDALAGVAGYTVANDLSARDRGARDGVRIQSPFRYDWIAHKSFDGSCPLGPWIVPAADVGDPQKLALKLWVNDVLKQDSNTASMIFTTAEQIAHLSHRITLYPGDVVLTGTPAGVGAESGVFLAPGDVVRASIERIGELETRFV
jgi:2-keto-4-pentenoate hydratase/2-oxohepta-3-ene-1,7-dioic acid hydratase in catechol pathway